MSATIVSVAEAVKDALNGATFSQAFTAERKYIAAVKLEELDTLNVTVGLRALAIERATRSKRWFDCGVSVVIRKRAGTDQLVGSDALVFLEEEVVDFLSELRIASPVAKPIEEPAADPIYDAGHLNEWNQFTGVIAATFRVER